MDEDFTTTALDDTTATAPEQAVMGEEGTSPVVTIHPTLQGLIPPLAAEELAQLTANLQAEGCRDALVVWEEEQILLDGHNRLGICQEYHLPYRVQSISLPNFEAAILWVLRNQLGRRNLCDLDRVALALKLKPALAAQAKGRQGTRTDIPQNSAECFESYETRNEVAALANVSHDTVHKASTILDHGAPSLIGAVRERQASIHTAATIATLPEEEQAEIVARGKKEILAAAKQIRAEQRATPRPEDPEAVESSIITAPEEGAAPSVEDEDAPFSLARVCALGQALDVATAIMKTKEYAHQISEKLGQFFEYDSFEYLIRNGGTRYRSLDALLVEEWQSGAADLAEIVAILHEVQEVLLAPFTPGADAPVEVPPAVQEATAVQDLDGYTAFLLRELRSADTFDGWRTCKQVKNRATGQSKEEVEGRLQALVHRGLVEQQGEGEEATYRAIKAQPAGEMA